MAEIKTPNWRLSSVAPQSTGHQYQITDRRTGQVLYFDSVKVYDGHAIDQVRFKRDDESMKSGESRSGIIRGTGQFDGIILDALKNLQGGGTITEMGTRVND